jgi:hypothetical protein
MALQGCQHFAALLMAAQPFDIYPDDVGELPAGQPDFLLDTSNEQHVEPRRSTFSMESSRTSRGKPEQRRP